jgi:hypothetical protein
MKQMYNGGIPSALNEYEDQWWMQNYIWKISALHINPLKLDGNYIYHML